MGTTWNEVPGVGWLNWLRPFAKQLLTEQMAMWRGAIQPWDTPQYRNMEQSARRAADLMRQSLLDVGSALNLSPDLVKRNVQGAAENVASSLPAVAQAIRQQSDPWLRVLQQLDMAQRTAQLGLRLKELQAAQDAQREAEKQSLFGGIAGVLGGLLPFGLSRIFPSPFESLLAQLASQGVGTAGGGGWVGTSGLMMGP